MTKCVRCLSREGGSADGMCDACRMAEHSREAENARLLAELEERQRDVKPDNIPYACNCYVYADAMLAARKK